MRKLRLYFDTSVFNFAFADDAPLEREVTLKLIAEVKSGKYDVYISEIVLREIYEAPSKKAEASMRLVAGINPVEITFDEDCHQLAMEYVNRGIIPKKYEDDAFHIAVASANDTDVLVSWNFQHIVKLKTQREVSATNLLMGYRAIEICSPMEVIDNG